MTNRLKKYGMMIIAAVLLVALAFAGAASADPVADPTLISSYSELRTYLTGEGAQNLQLASNFPTDTWGSGQIVIGTGAKTLDLNGKTITVSGSRFAKVGAGKEFTLTDSSGAKTGTITGGYDSLTGGCVIVDGGTFTMNGGTITNCKTDEGKSGGGVYVNSGGMFIMNGGTISKCSSGNGGAVCLHIEGVNVFTMNGGTISECSGVAGGGVDLRKGSKFTMNGGKITGCVAKNDTGYAFGGGVYVEGDASFEMNGGSIENCEVKGKTISSGGGIHGVASSTIKIDKDASIVGCKNSGTTQQTYGGGITVMSYATVPSTFGMKGTIKDCIVEGDDFTRRGGGIYVSYSSLQEGGATIVLEDAIIENCTAGSGGGLYVSASYTGDKKTLTVALKNVSINNCTAVYDGGGLYAKGIKDDAVDIQMTGGSIKDCSADCGAGAYLEVSKLTLKSGSAYVDGTNAVHLYSQDSMIEVDGTPTPSTSGFGVHLITLEYDATNPLSAWKDATIVKGGAAIEDYDKYFKLSTDEAYESYVLLPGGEQDQDLIFSQGYAITYENLPADAYNPNPERYVETESVTFKPASKSGYHFFAWYSDKGLKTETTGIELGSTGDKTVYAKMPANETAVTFTYEDKSSVSDKFTYNDSVTIPPKTPTKFGYVFHWMTENKAIDVDDCVSDSIWTYDGPDDGTLDFLATYIVIDHDVPVNQEGKAEFTDENTIAITNEAIDKEVDKIELKTVGGLTGGIVNLIGDAYEEYSAGIPVSSGMRKVDVAVFEINVDTANVGQNPYFTMELTLADEKDKDKVMFWHYNMTNAAWDKESLTKAIETENEKVITYKVETESFSPFAITLETKNSSGSSHQGGSRILPATDAPTVTPTQQPTTDATPAVPTVKPTQQQTQKSPAPFVGIVLGLGAAAVLLRLRR